MQLWKSNNRAPLAPWWNREQATIVTVSLSCALKFSAHLFPPVAPLAHNCWTALMRTLHCRSAVSVVCPSSVLSFFSSRSAAFLHQHPGCGVTASLVFIFVVFFQSAFDDAQDSHYNDLWQNVFCRSSPHLLPPPLSIPSAPHPPTDATPAPSCTHPAQVPLFTTRQQHSAAYCFRRGNRPVGGVATRRQHSSPCCDGS